jgi:interferon, gamma-inducible protein 30
LTALALCVGYLVAWDPSSGTVPAMAEINNKLSANQAVLKDETKYEGRKVQIDFYMESMCPGCRYFGTGDLVNLLNGLTDYVNLRAIPYGNAGVNKTTGELACQHGPEECAGNRIELCMMKQYPDWKMWFPAFKCIEKSDDAPANATAKCLPAHGMDLDAVLACADGPEGDSLHRAAGNETDALSPPHSFTPWLVVDGTAMNSSELLDDLVNQVCMRLPENVEAGIRFCHPRFKQNTGGMQLAGGRSLLCYPSK